MLYVLFLRATNTSETEICSGSIGLYKIGALENASLKKCLNKKGFAEIVPAKIGITSNVSFCGCSLFFMST